MDHCDVKESALSWFKSYLENRKHTYTVMGNHRILRIYLVGVPQGSVLGPLLFLLYINDLPNISKILDFYLFADDTNIYYEGLSLQDLEKKMNKELKKLNLWLNINRLFLNVAKTNFVIFHPYNNVTIIINKTALKESDHIKYLGVMIDSTLSWCHLQNQS